MYGVFTKGVDMLQKNFRSDVANPATIRYMLSLWRIFLLKYSLLSEHCILEKSYTLFVVLGCL